MIENLLLVFIILLVISYIYLKLAKKYNIVDKPSLRGSHLIAIPTAGGIIVYISVVLFFIINNFQYPFFFIGTSIIAVISFIDDIKQLSVKFRIIFQFISIILLLFDIETNGYVFYIFCIFFGVYFVNIYNFMDGINGLMASYSLITIIGLLIINLLLSFENYYELLTFPVISLIVFSFYNLRKKALVFSGDVGSITIAMIIVFLLFKAFIVSRSPLIISLVLIYLVDSSLTILIRLRNKENITESHRKHLYQNLYDKTKLSQVQVALIYSVLQVIVTFIAIVCITKPIKVQFIIFTMEVSLAFILYFWFLKKMNKNILF